MPNNCNSWQGISHNRGLIEDRTEPIALADIDLGPVKTTFSFIDLSLNIYPGAGELAQLLILDIEVCLANAEGKEVEEWRGEQIMYDLADGRLMFVLRSVRDQLRKRDIKPGERFQICKHEVDDPIPAARLRVVRTLESR